MPEREGSTEGEEGRRYDAGSAREHSAHSEAARSAEHDLRRVGDREVWSGTMEATITDTDVEAGEWRRAEQFED